ncbi:dystrophin-like [Tupaia chinensis]|uniref:dystrophin-like n=1 Tax=Tupaia chinensis TaxID=246437 RepID=UPI000FFC59A5|nr:dystrophin-like [Tupaia chinensis]
MALLKDLPEYKTDCTLLGDGTCFRKEIRDTVKAKSSSGSNRIKNVKLRLDVDITELHSWITRSEAVLQSPEFAIYRKEGNFSDLKEKVNAIEREKAEKFRKLQDASRSAQALVEQMVNEGINADSIKQASEQLNSRWIEFCQLLSERLNWLEYQNNIITFYNQLQQLEQMTTTAENWLKTQPTATSDPTAIKSQLKICKDEVNRLSALQPQIERLKIQSVALKEKGQGPMFLDADFVAFTNHFNQVFVDVQAKEKELQTIFDTLPPIRYQETMSTIRTWIQQSETKLSIHQLSVTDYEIMEQRLEELQALQSSLQEQESGLNYLSTTVKEMSKKAPSEISRKYQSEFEEMEGRWKKLSSQLVEHCQKLDDQMNKLRKIQVILFDLLSNHIKTLRKWMAEVDVFLKEEWPALGDSEILKKQLKQCRLLVNDIQTIQPSLNSVNEGGQKIKHEAEPEFASRLEAELRELNAQWDYVCQQVYDRKEALKGGLDKTISLQKDLSEMHEWMTQAEEEYLERDFEYKTPDELQTAVEEMKRAKEEAQQKETKVKLLTESVNSVIAQAPPVAQEALKKELDTLTTNYQWLCTRLNGKCKTLEEVWACWHELLSYLEKANKWLNEVELKLKTTENVPGGAEEISEVLDSLENLMQHSEDNPNQIRILAQTLTDGGVMDELINEELETFNSRWRELHEEAVRRQKLLEQSIQSAQEIEKSLHLIQESLEVIDKQLAAYIADKVDAAQMPQEAQCEKQSQTRVAEDLTLATRHWLFLEKTHRVISSQGAG